MSFNISAVELLLMTAIGYVVFIDIAAAVIPEAVSVIEAIIFASDAVGCIGGVTVIIRAGIAVVNSC